jgi:ribosomal protein S18 acetylase RimI-like enzyme
VEAIVRAAAVFSAEEVGVAMEVFDAAVAGSEGGKAESVRDYDLLGAFSGDELVGYAVFGPTPATDRTFDLYWIAVHPDSQGSGAGTALMDAVERRLADGRARMLVIETSSRDDYVPTRTFYKKRGYHESARLRDFYSPGDDRLVLTRRLDAAPSPGGPDRSHLPDPHP